MLRKIIKIDEEKCNGCGLCAKACHEGAIDMVGGKAKLAREDFCDGLGDCLPECPAGAISFEMREAPAYNEKAVREAKEVNASGLGQWPCQIKLMPVTAPYYQGASLLVAADCTAYAYASMHDEFMKGKVTVIGCPKLDGIDYSQKLAAIFAENDIRDITLTRMEVPCCGGLEMAVKRATALSGKNIPIKVVTISRGGAIL